MKRSWMVMGVAMVAALAVAGCQKMKTEEGAATAESASEAAPAAEAVATTPGTAGTIAITTANGPVNFTVEVATTDAQKSAGLMNREELPENAGMWFVFETPGIYEFWMKDTKIDLDWIFVDVDPATEQMKVVAILPDNKACDQGDLCPKAKPDVAFRNVLEVRAGTAAKNAIKVGDVVQSRIGPAQ